MFSWCYSSKVNHDNLSDVNYNETVKFVPPVSEGKVIKVYDGDTITIASKLPFIGKDKDTIWRFSTRLNGIDCPEIRGKSLEERMIAIKARDKLSDMILNKLVQLKDVKLEKYGRLLATVVYNKIDLNEWMVDQRLAVRYDGGTKIVPDNWEVYYEGVETEWRRRNWNE